MTAATTMTRVSKHVGLAALSVAVVISAIACNAATAQSRSDLTADKWSKTKEERDSRLSIADRGHYDIGWIDIVGDTYTRDREFRKKMVPDFREGHVFTPRSLDESIRRISRMKTIYPISIDNVQVILDEKNKVIHFAIKVKQKPRQ